MMFEDLYVLYIKKKHYMYERVGFVTSEEEAKKWLSEVKAKENTEHASYIKLFDDIEQKIFEAADDAVVQHWRDEH